MQATLVVHWSLRPHGSPVPRVDMAYRRCGRPFHKSCNALMTRGFSFGQIRGVERFSAVSAAASEGHELIEWVVKHGGSVQGVVIHSWQGKDGGSGYGLKADRDIKAGEELIVLPRGIQLQQDRNDPASLKQMMDRIPEELWGAKLALKLLYERLRGDEGHFWPYIENLPVGFVGLPLFFDQKTIEALEYPPVSSQVIKRCRWLIQFAKNELKKEGDANPFHGTQIDANSLGWAFAAVTSRAFRPGGPKSAGVLLPLIDMCNHSFSPNAKVIGSKAGNKNDSLFMVAMRDIAADEPIMLSYGNLPNDFLLLDYGFIVEENPYDTVKLSFDVGFVEGAKAVANVGSLVDDESETIKVIPWKQKMLENLGLHIDKEVSIIWCDKNESPVDARLLAGVRVLCATKESECKSHDLGNWNEDIRNKAWELSSLKTLMGMCIIALSQFTTSSAQDVDLIKEHDGDYALALRLRKEKKALISQAIERIKERITKVQGGDKSESKQKKSKKNSSNKGFGANK